MTKRHLNFALILNLLLSAVVIAQGTRLLRHPTVSTNLVAFEYAGDLWIVSRAGGTARRLTSTPGVESNPHFSPDGSQIAFTSTVARNTDVYVMPTPGGDPKRLTFHPSADRVRGWSPDGQTVLFASVRTSSPLQAYNRLWTISSGGGMPKPVALPRAYKGAYSPDGSKLAFEEISMEFVPPWEERSMWRHYRGGRTHPISVVNLADNSVEKVPWKNSNDSSPMWVGNTIFFVSDRDHTANLFAFQTDTRRLTKLTNHTDFDVMNASAGTDAVVYEQAGYVHILDIKSGNAKRLNIEVRGDLPWTRPKYKKVSGMIRNARLSPGGIRAAFEARGEIFTVPSAKVRELTTANRHGPLMDPESRGFPTLAENTN
jgi:tricorn protease